MGPAQSWALRAVTANISICESAAHMIAIQFSSFYEEWKTFIWTYINFVENCRVGIVDKISEVTTQMTFHQIHDCWARNLPQQHSKINRWNWEDRVFSS